MARPASALVPQSPQVRPYENILREIIGAWSDDLQDLPSPGQGKIKAKLQARRIPINGFRDAVLQDGAGLSRMAQEISNLDSDLQSFQRKETILHRDDEVSQATQFDRL